MNNDLMNVSRVEFYQALSVIWLFTSFAFGVHLSAAHGWDTVLYFLVSLAMALLYFVTFVRLLFRRLRQPAAD